jgi:hypothetical protein
VVALALVPAARHARASSGAIGPIGPIGPKAYYLALGDSLAFGYQPNLQFFRGYADLFYATALRFKGVGHYINMGCGGETSVTFIRAGVPSPSCANTPTAERSWPPLWPFCGSTPLRSAP